MGLLSALFPPKHEVIPAHIGSVADFQREVEDCELPVILDVWSETCAPCRQLAPVLTEVATRYEGRVRVAEVSTSSGPIDLLRELGVTSTPTILVYHRGEEMGRVVGYHPRSWFDQMIETEFPEDSG